MDDAVAAFVRRYVRSLGTLVRPKSDVVELEIKLSGSARPWVVRRDGDGWKVIPPRSPGRPRKPGAARRALAILETYEQALSHAQALQTELCKRFSKDVYITPADAVTEQVLAYLQSPEAPALGKWLRPVRHARTLDGAKYWPTLVTSKGRPISTGIDWDDLCQGEFEPRKLAEVYVGSRFGIAASVVRKHVKEIRRRQKGTQTQ